MHIEPFAIGLIQASRAVGTEVFYEKLKLLLTALVSFDELLVLQFYRDKPASLLYQYSSSADSRADMQYGNHWDYLASLYVLDPYYRAFADDRHSGFFSKDQIAPDEFDQIYNAYFNYLKLSDEVGFLFEIEGGSCLHIDLSRFDISPKFSSQAHHTLLQMASPLKELCISHMALVDKHQNTDLNRAVNIEQLLANFGKEILTNKEYQVCQLLLQGHSTKAIANTMKIGVETVKMHKKNIYSKTFMSGQSELLGTFIEIIQQPDLDSTIDHLQHHVINAPYH